MPQRLAIATPFHRPSPWCTSSYPASLNVLTGASASPSLVSCIRSTSGFARSSHHMTFSRRAFSELTFQVAIRMAKDYPICAASSGGNHFASWKITPRVKREPERTVLTPCRMLTR